MSRVIFWIKVTWTIQWLSHFNKHNDKLLWVVLVFFFIRDAIYIVRSVEAQSKHNGKQYPPYTLGVFKRQPDKTKPSMPRLVVREYSTFVIPEGDCKREQVDLILFIEQVINNNSDNWCTWQSYIYIYITNKIN